MVRLPPRLGYDSMIPFWNVMACVGCLAIPLRPTLAWTPVGFVGLQSNHCDVHLTRLKKRGNGTRNLSLNVVDSAESGSSNWTRCSDNILPHVHAHGSVRGRRRRGPALPAFVRRNSRRRSIIRFSLIAASSDSSSSSSSLLRNGVNIGISAESIFWLISQKSKNESEKYKVSDRYWRVRKVFPQSWTFQPEKVIIHSGYQKSRSETSNFWPTKFFQLIIQSGLRPLLVMSKKFFESHILLNSYSKFLLWTLSHASQSKNSTKNVFSISYSPIPARNL